MGQPYVGEIRMFAGNFPPAGWMFCDGTPLAISENEVLFQLIGTTYGGDGEETFNLPNLASRVPIHMGTGPDGTTYQIGEMAGTEEVTLSTTQIPSHTHAANATSTNQALTPEGAYFASITSSQSGVNAYLGDGAVPDSPLNMAMSASGGSQPHDNMQRFLCVNFIISLFGLFPSPT